MIQFLTDEEYAHSKGKITTEEFNAWYDSKTHGLKIKIGQARADSKRSNKPLAEKISQLETIKKLEQERDSLYRNRFNLESEMTA